MPSPFGKYVDLSDVGKLMLQLDKLQLAKSQQMEVLAQEDLDQSLGNLRFSLWGNDASKSDVLLVRRRVVLHVALIE